MATEAPSRPREREKGPGDGAGYGDPKNRDPNRVQADLDADLISEEHAKKWYL